LRPQMVSPLWLGNVVLTSVLLLVPRKFSPVLLTAGLAGFFLYDLQGGGPIGSILWLILSNAVQVLIAVAFLRRAFEGAPRLNSVNALAKFAFYAVFLAPFVGAFFGALSSRSNYWASWKVAFLSEALGYLTLMPAILGWVREVPTWKQKPRTYYMEAAALIIGLVFLGTLAFNTPGRSSPPALLYSLVPLLLWSTLRFGSTGVSTSMITIAFVSIWGAVHGRGPFAEPGLSVNVLSLQLFLFFTAAPFMALAAVAEESKDAEQALRQKDQALNEAQRLAQIGSWQWDIRSDAVTWSAELYRLTGYNPELPVPTFKNQEKIFTSESWHRLKQSVERALQTGEHYELDLEIIRPDGTNHWISARGEAVVDGDGNPIYLRGTAQDITSRKLSEAALVAMSGRLIKAQEEERVRIARELHDDLSQRMALLSIKVEQFEQGIPDLSSESRQQVRGVSELASEVSSTLYDLTHQLHPFRLDSLGLVSSLAGLCREFGDQHNLNVQFVHCDVPSQIPMDVSLCLFRIVQEALRNVTKHSGAEVARVELTGHGDRIDLGICDPGAGFDVQSASGTGGLGLISMRERLRLVGGHISIESEPSQGTQIRVHIPQSNPRVDLRAC